MKKYIYRTFIILVFALTSCESYLIHGNLDGFWQVKSIENKQTGEITQCKGDIYYSFQRDLILVSYISPETPKGQMKDNYIAYFTHEDNFISMTDFRIYIDRDGKVAPLSKLAKFGLYDTFNTFNVEKLDNRSLVLDSDKAHIILHKH